MAMHGRVALIDARWTEVQPGGVLDAQTREKNDKFRTMLYTLLEEGELPDVAVSGTIEPYKWLPGDIHIEGIIVATPMRILAIDGGKKQKSATIHYDGIRRCIYEGILSRWRIDLEMPLSKNIKIANVSSEVSAQTFVDYVNDHLNPYALDIRMENELDELPNEDRVRSRVDQQWETVKPSSWGRRMHSGERKMLYRLLSNGENIESMVGGTYRAEQDTNRHHKHNGIAVATDKRIIFLDQGVFGSTEVSEIPYRSVEAITYSTGILMAGVQITGQGVSGFRIEDISDKKSVKPFVDCVRVHLEMAYGQNTSGREQPVAFASAADEIEKLAGLLEKGILTQEEFDAKKRQLLGL